jgi:hypothetical protein
MQESKLWQLTIYGKGDTKSERDNKRTARLVSASSLALASLSFSSSSSSVLATSPAAFAFVATCLEKRE